jgi:hypothetical protein
MADSNQEEQCCPEFDPSPWQDQQVTWQDKLFIKETVPQFLHIPLPGTFGKAVARMWTKIEAAGAKPDTKDFIMLSAESSPWKGEIYINTTKEIPGSDNVALSGTFLTKVFDGSYNAVPKWIQQMDQYAKDKGSRVKNYYFYYTTCPKCAKKYGHNYTVLFAQI